MSQEVSVFHHQNASVIVLLSESHSETMIPSTPSMICDMKAVAALFALTCNQIPHLCVMYIIEFKLSEVLVG